ncbi:exosortase-associated EpsI family protein [Desulfopila sp. IMCC35008]|uniref:exosortase-associated EpsI family protein n=1 Tax=Desulfopila sp. IMCC35008 TaxID=2653858 RepID=UPI0035174791
MEITAEVHPVPIKQSLGQFPKTIGDYRLANTFQSSADVIEMLGVDDYLQYNYINPENDVINL